MTALQLTEQGAELAAQGEFISAVTLFQRAVQLDPRVAAVHEMLAQCHTEAGQHDEAYGAALQAVQLRPDWSDALLTLGRAARNAGRLEEAAAAYSSCLQQCALTSAAAPVTEGEDADAATAAEHELAEVHQLLRARLGHQLGLPGLRLLEQRGAELGPGGVAWEAGVLLAWFLVQKAGGGTCQPSSFEASETIDSATVSNGTAGERPQLGANPLHGARVLELGAGGTGVVGLTAACLGAHVMATDLPEVVPQLEASIALNRGLVGAAGGSIQAASLDWASPNSALLCPPPPACQYDWLLGADLVFRSAAVGPLVATIAAAVRHRGTLTSGQGNRASTGEVKVLIGHKHRHEEVDCGLLEGLKAAGVALRAVLRDEGTHCTLWANDAAYVVLSM